MRVSVRIRLAPVLRALVVGAALSGGSAVAATIVPSSLADYEPRLTRPTGSNPGEQLAIDPAIDTPSDAANLRIGGQSRFRIGSAYFFPLQPLLPGQTLSNAHLSFTQIADSATGGVAPTFNADLRVVGITQDVSVNNDPDNPKVDPTVNPAISADLYNDTDADERAPLGTTVPRLRVQDNFLSPAQYIANGGTAAVRGTSSEADALLTAYLNSLYAAGVPEGSFLVVTLTPDAPPSDVTTTRYQIASANAADAGQRPTLSFDVVPEPGATGMLAVAATGLLARRRRRA